nr:hypothetical protein [Candidatus Levybacteria bacterium]
MADKNKSDSLESNLKTISSSITQPASKVASTIGSIVDAINPLTKSEKPKEEKEIKNIIRSQKHNNITWTDIENPSRK